MNKRLPNVFANRNARVESNNEEMFYSGEDNKESFSLQNDNIKKIMVRKKINDIFNSKKFVYKAKVVITTSEGDKEYTLIAKNNDTLLTINNESIPINDIIDIKEL